MLSDLNLPMSHEPILHILRLYFNGFAVPHSMSWITALTTTDIVYDEIHGPQIAVKTLQMLKEIRLSRRSPFNFNSPACPSCRRTQEFLSAVLACRPVPLDVADPLDLDRRETLTSDEVVLLDAVLAMRTDNTPRARILITQLTTGRVTAAAVQTGLSLAHILDAQPSQIRRPAAPQLRAVG